MYLIVGLGNPGPEYENTRHNMGFKVVENLAKNFNIDSLKRKKKCDAYIAETRLNGIKIILAQPQTFMNNSGGSVQSLLSWNKIKPDHLIVVYDDVDLEPGQIRIREEGGAGGHRGVESILKSIGSTKFIRVRIGIGRPNHGEVADYVLSGYKAEYEKLFTSWVFATDAILEIILSGISSAMNKFSK